MLTLRRGKKLYFLDYFYCPFLTIGFLKKNRVPKPGMKVVKLGGPCYRIGVGGGAASSTIQGKNEEELDFQAVQRGDAEMEQKVNRVIRACCELGDKNPIVSIHDQVSFISFIYSFVLSSLLPSHLYVSC